MLSVYEYFDKTWNKTSLLAEEKLNIINQYKEDINKVKSLK